MEGAEMSDRCTGHCCKLFFLPYSPDELRFSYAQWLQRSKEGQQPLYMGGVHAPGSLVESGPGVIWDIHLVYPMVRYLGKMVPPEGTFAFDYGEGHFYTCVHYKASPDGEGGDCGIYDFRPAMCRDYPYGGKCRDKACTWDQRSEAMNPTPNEPERKMIALEVALSQKAFLPQNPGACLKIQPSASESRRMPQR